MPKRGERAARPRGDASEWEVRFSTSDAAKGWEDLCAQASDNVAVFYDAVVADPRSVVNPRRQGRLKGSLATASVRGEVLEQWQYEITGGGRIWYGVDDNKRIVWITAATVGHPKATE